MAGMSIDKNESLIFYKYLCQKIGSEEVVRIRRLNFVIYDIGQRGKHITSGSKGEGLDLKGSDLDVMVIDDWFEVIESEAEIVFEGQKLYFIMNTEETRPCFAQLCIVPNPIHANAYVYILNMLQKNHLGNVLSSEQYRQATFWTVGDWPSKIHGPCVSDRHDEFDYAPSIRCYKWISQAKPWVSRPRTTWPSSAIISKIISCGVLFVPIGSKGSINESLEWRMSFSIAEKILIFSFSHTQILCYAMLKILLKEIVEKHEDSKGLLCSYFLKTLMFWISEETEIYVWRPDNIIPCFMACLQRLLYCVNYSILSHYFIPDNNLFFFRFNTNNKHKLTTILKNVYEQGINCFASSETLQDYQSQFYEFPESLISGNLRFFHQLMPTFITISRFGIVEQWSRLMYNVLRHSRTDLSRGLFALQLSKAFMFAPKATIYQSSSGNKHQYMLYKHDLNHLMIGLHSDAVSGLLMLASFFYVHKNYSDSLTVIAYTLQKFTNEKIFSRSFLHKNTFNDIQKHMVNLMKKEKLQTIIKTLIIHPISFNRDSSLVPQELHLAFTRNYMYWHPLEFAHFLSFLCYYHLHDIQSCYKALLQMGHHYLTTIVLNGLNVNFPETVNSHILIGIAYQLLGATFLAKQNFQIAAWFNAK